MAERETSHPTEPPIWPNETGRTIASLAIFVFLFIVIVTVLGNYRYQSRLHAQLVRMFGPLTQPLAIDLRQRPFALVDEYPHRGFSIEVGPSEEAAETWSWPGPATGGQDWRRRDRLAAFLVRAEEIGNSDVVDDFARRVAAYAMRQRGWDRAVVQVRSAANRGIPPGEYETRRRETLYTADVVRSGSSYQLLRRTAAGQAAPGESP